MENNEPIWRPTREQIAAANVTRFIHDHVQPLGGSAARVHDSRSLYDWSIAEPSDFWKSLATFCDLRLNDDVVVEGGDFIAAGGTRWFPNATLNFAEQLLRHNGDRDALVYWTENGRARTLSFAALRTAVAQCASVFRELGVKRGDRVAGFLPNIPEAVVAMLAAASIGAVWSSCSPDFGRQGVLDRFGQIEPTVLVTADEYRYSGKNIDVLEKVRSFVNDLPSVRRVLVVRNGESGFAPLENALDWADTLAAHRSAALEFAQLPFDHPLYIMYSSGTTGLPKCMVHGAGGTLLQHMKELVLHTDLNEHDRIFYFTTCGWMMWNWLVSSLAVGATVVLYDGAPLLRNRTVVWDLVSQEGVSVFGTSAKWLALSEKENRKPRETHDISALRTILSTGSPLTENSYDYVYRDVKSDVMLSSISGGTDIISCFALGDPTLPVFRGELQTRGLGMRVEVWDAAGKSVVGQAGELVCTAPFPSMPVAFWNDPDRAKFRAAYFEHFPGVWRHGDWATLTVRGGMIIHGRSDATLNPGGIRIGTAEIYRQVDELPEVVESVVIGQDFAGKRGADVRIVLFVRMREGELLDDNLRDRIKARIRANTTAHHVPKKIIQVADIPRTVSGKISEIAVREVVHGRPVMNVEALANPEALELYRDLPELLN